MPKLKSFNSLLSDKLQNPEFAEEYRKAKIEVNFGLSVIRARELREMTQTELAQQADIRQETLSRIERGRLPDFKTIKKLAQILNVGVTIYPDGHTLLEAIDTTEQAA